MHTPTIVKIVVSRPYGLLNHEDHRPAAFTMKYCAKGLGYYQLTPIHRIGYVRVSMSELGAISCYSEFDVLHDRLRAVMGRKLKCL